MRERPILFSAPMVRAILDGTKTQTRRIAKPVKHPDLGNIYAPGALVLEREPKHVIERACPYGWPSDRLWVRETWAPLSSGYAYAADLIYNGSPSGRWHPSIHMPRAATRILLEVTGVRVERLQDISEADALAEGIQRPECIQDVDIGEGAERTLFNSMNQPVTQYRRLWERLNGPGSWHANPWVWVIEFRRIS